VGEHGPTKFLVDNLKPILEKYKVGCMFVELMQKLQQEASINIINSATVDFIFTRMSYTVFLCELLVFLAHSLFPLFPNV